MKELSISYDEDIEKVNNSLNKLRESFGLKPKRHESNLLFKDKWQEILHIIRISSEEIFDEYAENLKLWKGKWTYLN